MTDIRFFYDRYTVYPYYLPFITFYKKSLKKIWLVMCTRCIFVLTKANNNDNFSNTNDNRF